MASSTVSPAALRTLLICPDPELRVALAQIDGSCVLDILGDWAEYPAYATLAAHLGRLAPQVLLLDFASAPATALALVGELTSLWPLVRVVALDHTGDADRIVASIRAGATEYLVLPVDQATFEQAFARVRSLLLPEHSDSRPATGRVLAFSNAKPGSGASSLASQAAFAIRQATGASVLLVDLDLMGGTLADVVRSPSESSVLDLLRNPEQMQRLSGWKMVVGEVNGVDILAAPSMPAMETIPTALLQEFLFYARTFYDHVVLDLPCVVAPLVRLALKDVDTLYLVSTPELPSLHLARRALATLEQATEHMDRVRIVLNRVSLHDTLRGSNLAQLFRRPVDATVPNDYATLQTAVQTAGLVPVNSRLGQAILVLCGLVVSGPSPLRRLASAMGLARAASQPAEESVCPSNGEAARIGA